LMDNDMTWAHEKHNISFVGLMIEESQFLQPAFC